MYIQANLLHSFYFESPLYLLASLSNLNDKLSYIEKIIINIDIVMLALDCYN